MPSPLPAPTSVTTGSPPVTNPLGLKSLPPIAPAFGNANNWYAYHPAVEDYYEPIPPRAFDLMKLTPEARQDYLDKQKRLRNETITMAEKAVIYGGVAQVEMTGMYYQRVDAPGAGDLPLYNPDAPLTSLSEISWDKGIFGNVGVMIRTFDDRMMDYFGAIANRVYGIGAYGEFLANPVSVAEAEFSGDQWYSIGNFFKFTGQYVFSYLYRGELGFARKFAAYAANTLSAGGLERFKNSARVFAMSRSNVERGRAAVDYLKWAGIATALTAWASTKKGAGWLVSPWQWATSGSALARGAADYAGGIARGARDNAALLIGAVSTLTSATGRDTLALALEAEEQGRRLNLKKNIAGGGYSPVTIPDRWRLATLDFRAARTSAGQKLDAWVSGKQVENMLAKAQTKRSFYAASEKFIKFASPLAVTSGVAYTPVLPVMALAHLAILVSGYYVWQGTLPKMVLSRNKAKQGNMLQELGVSLGVYTGKAVQSAYTLYAGALEMMRGLGGGSFDPKHLYTNMMQAGKSMPEALTTLTTMIIVAPSLYSFIKETQHFVTAGRDLKAKLPTPAWRGFSPSGLNTYVTELGELARTWSWQAIADSSTEHFSEVDRLANHSLGLISASAGLMGAWYMSDFQTMPLAFWWCAVGSILTGVRTLHKHKETIRQKWLRRGEEKNRVAEVRLRRLEPIPPAPMA